MDIGKYHQYLINKFGDKTQLQRSVSDVVERLKNRVDIVAIDPSIENPTFFFITQMNCVNSAKNEECRATTENLDFEAYKLIPNIKSNHYYNQISDQISSGSSIIIIIEKKLDLITSNSEMLKLELLIDQGISSSLMEKQSTEYLAYLVLMDDFENERY